LTHGSTLFATLNVANGEITARYYPRRRRIEFLDFDVANDTLYLTTNGPGAAAQRLVHRAFCALGVLESRRSFSKAVIPARGPDLARALPAFRAPS
jgi:hypothetical protein